MQSYHGKHTKLHRSVHRLVVHLMRMMGHDPGEYTVHMHNRITKRIIEHCYPDSFMRMLLQATLTDTGIETRYTDQLGKWLLISVYQGDVRAMLEDWLELQHAERKQHGTQTKR